MDNGAHMSGGQGVASSNLASPTVKDLGEGFAGLHEGSQDVEWAPFQDIQDSQIPNPRAPDGEL